MPKKRNTAKTKAMMEFQKKRNLMGTQFTESEARPFSQLTEKEVTRIIAKALGPQASEREVYRLRQIFK